MKHGREQEKVLTIDERHFDARILSESLLQFHGDRETRKTTAENEYPFLWCIFHESSFPPSSCSKPGFVLIPDFNLHLTGSPHSGEVVLRIEYTDSLR